MARAPRRPKTEKPPLAEWIVAGIGALIVLGVLAFLLREALA
jgi:hypothetical protein